MFILRRFRQNIVVIYFFRNISTVLSILLFLNLNIEFIFSKSMPCTECTVSKNAVVA